MTVRELKDVLELFPDDLEIYPVKVIKMEDKSAKSPCTECKLSDWAKAACCGCEKYFKWKKEANNDEN